MNRGETIFGWNFRFCFVSVCVNRFWMQWKTDLKFSFMLFFWWFSILYYFQCKANYLTYLELDNPNSFKRFNAEKQIAQNRNLMDLNELNMLKNPLTLKQDSNKIKNNENWMMSILRVSNHFFGWLLALISQLINQTLECSPQFARQLKNTRMIRGIYTKRLTR